MKKSDLVKRIAAEAMVTSLAAGTAVDLVFSEIGEALARGETATIRGFGAFSTTSLAARAGSNPATGEQIGIPALKSVSFKASRGLNEMVNSAQAGERHGVAGGDSHALRSDPDYRADWREHGAPASFVEASAYPLGMQTEADLKAARWGLLTWEDPRARSRFAPFWIDEGMVEAVAVKPEKPGNAVAEMLRETGTTLTGLGLRDGSLVLKLKRGRRVEQIRMVDGASFDFHRTGIKLWYPVNAIPRIFNGAVECSHRLQERFGETHCVCCRRARTAQCGCAQYAASGAGKALTPLFSISSLGGLQELQWLKGSPFTRLQYGLHGLVSVLPPPDAMQEIVICLPNCFHVSEIVWEFKIVPPGPDPVELNVVVPQRFDLVTKGFCRIGIRRIDYTRSCQ